MPAIRDTGPSFTKAQQDNLAHLSALLHLFHHRNKNQHRRSAWYRHFSTFRKQLDALLAEIARLNAVPATHLERSRKVKQDVLLKDRIRGRLEFWRDLMVGKWHLAFSQLVADGRFAVLGVLLVAVLAECCAVVGVVGMLEEVGDVEVRGVIERFGREEGFSMPVLSSGEDVGVKVRREGGDRDAGLHAEVGREMGVESKDDVVDGKSRARRRTRKDVGSPVSEQGAGEGADEVTGIGGRPSDPVIQKPEESAAQHHSTKRPLSPPAQPKVVKKAKKRKKGDAIDELFSGLG